MFLPLSAAARLQWLYLPSAALFSGLWFRFDRSKVFISILFASWLISLCAQTLKRGTLASEPVKFFSYEISAEPQDYIAWCSLGLEDFKKGDYVAAKKYFEESIERSPGKACDIGKINLKAAEEKIK